MVEVLTSVSHNDIFGDPTESELLWFNKSEFLQPNFHPESYVADLRYFVPLDNLRSELRTHLTSLKNELVELINRDYADFVNLSTRLVDVDATVVRMRVPLLELREKIAQFRGNVEDSLSALKDRLKQRADASTARETLELLLDAFHVVSKVEKLITEVPSMSTDWSHFNVTLEKASVGSDLSIQLAENGRSFLETQSMLLERIASEMNHLKFYTAHAKDLPFVANMEPRIRNANSVLCDSLASCFAASLENHDSSAIYNCLRAYAASDNTSGAEEVFRTTIIAPRIKQIVAPHTSSHEIGEMDVDELEEDYHQIMQFINGECTFLLELSFSEGSGLHTFNFLANSILKEVLLAIQRGKPGAFSLIKPAMFVKNYKSTLRFLTYIEGFCNSRSAILKFRMEGVYSAFMKQWNIRDYFSLRLQEITGALDLALVEATLSPDQIEEVDQDNFKWLTLKQSIALLESMKACWEDDVFLLSCADRFLRLSLQLLSRYSAWLSSGLSARRLFTEDSNAASGWALSVSLDKLVYVLHDISCLIAELNSGFLKLVLDRLSSCPVEVIDCVKGSMAQGGEMLEHVRPIVMDVIIEGLVEKSVEDLRQLKGITATYRMTNKPLPVRHSPYVSSVLRPLRNFLDGEQSVYLSEDARGQLRHGVAEKITGRYYEMAADLVNVARKTESSLLRIRQGAQKRAGANADQVDHNITDTDKICMQLFLDVQEYGRNLQAIGVTASQIPAYCSLWQCVAPAEQQSSIVL